MALKAYNNGIRAKEIRCVDAGGVERIIREIRKGDVQWWVGEFNPPTIQGTWTKVADGLYQTKAIIPSYTTPRFLDTGKDTNYVVVSFHSYENYVTCEFFGDFERLTPQYGDVTNGVSGRFYVAYSWDDAAGSGIQEYVCNLNVFPNSSGTVTSISYQMACRDPMFTEDSSFVSTYGNWWVVQGVNAHNKMCSDAYGYYTESTVDPWGIYGRSEYDWYNEVKYDGTGVTNYVCSYNGRSFSVQSLSSSAVLKFCPPGGSESGWVPSEDAYFPASSGWLQREKKDGYRKFFNVNTGRFVEYLPKDMFSASVLQSARSSIGSHLTDAEYENRVVCTLFNETHLEKKSECVELKNKPGYSSAYYDEFWFDVYGIPFINLSTREYIFGHYNPSFLSIYGTDNDTTWSYVVSGRVMFDSVITMTYSNGSCTMSLSLTPADYWGWQDNTFLTGTYPKANYKYAFTQDNTEYVSLIVVCVANHGSDVVGDYHEYRLPAGASYALSTVKWTANGTSTSFTPANGYVKGTGHFSEIANTFMFVIRPSSLSGSYYHQIVFNHTNVSTRTNSKNLEISANLNYFGTTTYSTPQNSIAENRKLVPVYWRMGSWPDDRINKSYDGSRYMTSSGINCPLSVTMDWDEGHNTFTDDSWVGHYILPIATASPMTVAKATFMCTAIDEDTTLPGFGKLDFECDRIVTTSSVVMTNGTITITMNRSTGVVTITSTAKNNISGYTSNPSNFEFEEGWMVHGMRWLWWKDLTTNDQGMIDMATGSLDW